MTCFDCVFKISDQAIYCSENCRTISDEFTGEGDSTPCDKYMGMKAVMCDGPLNMPDSDFFRIIEEIEIKEDDNNNNDKEVYEYANSRVIRSA